MYDEHYGLTGRPFQLTPDPHFWFDTNAHRKAMSYLGYGLSQGEGFIVITGDVGAGKTTLVGHLLERIDHARLHAITIGSTQIQPDDLLRIVAAGLDVAQAGATKADLLTAIERGLHAVARSGRRTLLIVDEAQALPPSALEELRMLSNLSAGGHALLQIFLLGQPEFRQLLEGPGRLEQLRQRVIALHHLDPMGLEEVEPYMAHRLSLVGWNGAPRFTSAAFDALHRGSGGVPRLLNQLAARTMLFGAIEGLDTIDADAVEGALADIERDLPRPGEPQVVILVDDEAEAAAPTAYATPQAAREPTGNDGSAAIAGLQARLDTVESAARAAVEAGRPVAADIATLATRLAKVEKQAAQFDAADHPAVAQVSALTERVAELERLAVDSAAAARQDRAALADAAALAERIVALEARAEEQDATLRRILTLLVDWVETDKRPPNLPISLRA